MSDSRDRGLEFGDLESDLAEESYQMSNDEVVAQYGDREIEHARGSTTVREVLGNIDDEYEDHDELHEAILNMIGEEAVGDKEYSERGTAVEEGEETDAF